MENSLVFDIGANNGDDADAYLKHGRKVVAVEANPDLCAGLRERFAAEIASGRFVLVEKAISRRRRVTLYVNTSDHGWGTILLSYAEHGRKLRGELRPIEVETTTVIDLIREHGVPHRMKVDIEGVDYLCLLDLFDSDFRLIYRSSGRSLSEIKCSRSIFSTGSATRGSPLSTKRRSAIKSIRPSAFSLMTCRRPLGRGLSEQGRRTCGFLDSEL
jgi:FkbM family methyltransferase